MFGDLSNPKPENVRVTEDGDILALSLGDGIFVYKDGSWVKPNFDVFGSTLRDARQVPDDDWVALSESLKSTFAHKA